MSVLGNAPCTGPCTDGSEGKKNIWEIRIPRSELSSEEVVSVSKELGIRPVTAALLRSRGCRNAEEAKLFLSHDGFLLHDPFDLPDMDKAAARVKAAIDNKEKVTVYGDYDVDGVTSVSVLVSYLRGRGVDAGYYIPGRMTEGYGLSADSVAKVASDGTTLIITVDTGITAVEEAAAAEALGVDMVITDHHSCPELLPDACAVVNPQRRDSGYPFPALAGVGVVFKLISAVEYLFPHGEGEDWLGRLCSEHMDLVALGTIADVMPLTDENRLIASIGLRLISKTRRVGMKALLDAAGVTEEKLVRPSSSLIGYTVAPRVNAIGRLGNAATAAELFLTDDAGRAGQIAAELCETNKKRQAMESEIAAEAFEMLEKDESAAGDRVIVLASDSWHGGIIGIVASRITERYSKPAILISFEGDSGIGKGSGRSVRGFSLAGALSACSEHLVRFGGHEMAAGLSVSREELPAFREAINRYAEEHMEPSLPVLTADMELTPSEITLSQAEELTALEPFGTGNPAPVFVLRGAALTEVSAMGGGKHTRMVVCSGGKTFSAVRFGLPPEKLGIASGDERDILFSLEVNTYRGARSVQLITRDLELPPDQSHLREDAERLYGALISQDDAAFASLGAGAEYSAVLPDRSDFAAVYQTLKRTAMTSESALSENGGDVFSVSTDDLCRGLVCSGEDQIVGMICRMVKGRIIVDIFNEMNLIELIGADEKISFRLRQRSDKVNLERSTILRRIRRRFQSI